MAGEERGLFCRKEENFCGKEKRVNGVKEVLFPGAFLGVAPRFRVAKFMGVVGGERIGTHSLCQRPLRWLSAKSP